MPAKITISLQERIIASAKRIGECLIWQRPPTKSGYGLIWIDGRHVQVHRAAYEASKGLIPFGLLVLHKCDNRLCVEPAHLFTGTHKDNMRDMIAKGRDRHVAGTQHHNAKLTPEQAADIRRRFVPYDRTNGSMALAREFGVTQSSIYALLGGKTWKACGHGVSPRIECAACDVEIEATEA